MLMGRIAQEGTPLHTSLEVLHDKGDVAPLCDQPADREAPVGLEVLHHPVVALHGGEWLNDGGQRRGEVRTGTRLAQIPEDLTRGDDKRGDQGPHPMPDVRMRAFFRFARCQRLWGVLAWQNLPAGLCIAANDHTALLKES